MALATVQSVSTTAWSASTASVVVTKPSGTVDGDYLLAFIRVKNPDAVNSVPTGWTEKLDITASGSANGKMYVYEKVASSEGSSWSWGLDATTAAAGAVIRINGQKSSGAYGAVASAGVTNSATPSIANGITPTAANSLLVMLMDSGDVGAGTSISSYAIATSDPGTWVEQFELYSSGEDKVFSVATANRVETTGTGNTSCAVGDADTDTRSALISILSEPNVTVLPSVLDLTLSIQAPAISGGAVVTIAAPVDLTLSVQAPTVSSPTPDWTNTDKSATSTFTNPDKS